MKHLAYTAAEFRKNVSKPKKGGVTMSIRSTRTSEISSFVKNCNSAETEQLKKELMIWHKDTDFNVRKMDRKCEVMYKNLLQISTEKKKIKNTRQNKANDKQINRKWIGSDRRFQRRPNIFVQNLETNFNQIPENDETTSSDEEELLMNDAFRSKTGKKLKNMNPRNEPISLKKTIDQATKQADLAFGSEKMIPENEIVFDRNRLFTDKTSTINLNLSKKNENLTTKNNHQAKHKIRSFLLKDEENNTADDQNHKILFINEDTDYHIRHNTKDDFLLKQLPDMSGKVNLDHILGNYRKPKPSEGFPPPISRDTYHRKVPKKKPKPDPSNELYMSSSIKARPGKVYNVSVYKKDTKGNLEGEVLPLDTTIDVYKHFKIASHRERLQRKQLLLEAQNVEVLQRHRVNDFLKKLDREDALKSDAEIKRKKQAEREIELLRKQLEARNRPPPQYGESGLNNVPNYVRIKIKPTKSKNPNQNSFVRKRSSWSVPSIYTLNLPGSSGKQLQSMYDSSIGNTTGGNIIPPSGSSHLVNINTAKYYQEA